MNEHRAFRDSISTSKMLAAERELTSFMAAVTKLYSPEQGRMSAEDWLYESELIDSPPRSKPGIGGRSRPRRRLDSPVE